MDEMLVLGKTIEQLKGHVEPGAKGLTLIKVSHGRPFGFFHHLHAFRCEQVLEGRFLISLFVFVRPCIRILMT